MNEKDKSDNVGHKTIDETNPITKPPRLKPARKKKRRDKSDLGDNFVAPDGGWGWLVAIASGVCIVSKFFLRIKTRK